MSSVKRQEGTLQKTEKISIKRDLIILSVSIAFTITVACFILTHIKNYQTQSDVRVEHLVKKLLSQKLDDLEKFKSHYERKHGDINDSLRSKRAIHEFRVTNAGKANKINLFKDAKLNYYI